MKRCLRAGELSSDNLEKFTVPVSSSSPSSITCEGARAYSALDHMLGTSRSRPAPTIARECPGRMKIDGPW